MFPAEITTERLLLRHPTEADAERLFSRYCQDREVCRYMSWGPHRSIDDTHEYLRRITSENEAGTTVGFLIFSRQTNELLGSVGGRLAATMIQWGYCLARDAWGQGFATEAARAFAREAIKQPSIWRLQAFCDLENRASHRLAACGKSIPMAIGIAWHGHPARDRRTGILPVRGRRGDRHTRPGRPCHDFCHRLLDPSARM